MKEQGASSPERVVLIVIDLAGGGTQKVVAGLAQALAGAGSRVTIVTNQAVDRRWEDLSSDVELIELEGRITTDRLTGAPPVFSNARWLVDAALAIRRVVRTTGPRAPVLAFLPGTNVLTAIACLGLRVPLVLSERNDVTRQPQSFALRTARRLIYRTASVITTNRPRDVATLESLAGRAPVRVVRNPPPRTSGYAEPLTARRILSIGRLTRHKRHGDVVEAFGRLAEAFPGWTLRILGDGPERPALEEQVRQLGLEGSVEFPGWATDIGTELIQGALLVHASEYEGTSNAIIEGMAAGLPVIASESSAPAGSGMCGTRLRQAVTVFPISDVTALTIILEAMLRDDATRAKRGMTARHAARQFTAQPLPEWLSVMNLAAQRFNPGT